jgi:hypothetical protein
MWVEPFTLSLSFPLTLDSMISWHMLYSFDLQRLPVCEQLLTFAKANLDAAETLCTRLCSEKDGAGYADGAVVMSLTFHSLELFFKGGILKLHPDEQFGGRSGHDLDSLSKRYFNLYPKQEFQFEVPFRREFPEVLGEMTTEELTALRAYIEDQNRKTPEDQRHRYPIGTDGKTWEGAFGFEPTTFLETLRGLQRAYADARLFTNAG